MKRALICGVSGQDGSYLARLLLSKSYIVWGTSRDHENINKKNHKLMNIDKDITYVTMAPNDFRSVYLAIIESNPDEIYFLSGQSSVGLSYKEPSDTITGITMGLLNILEACRIINNKIRVYNASSSECYGANFASKVTEETPFSPLSPYGVAKASAHWMAVSYRVSYDMFISNGILFNHESCLRPERFVTQKIVQAAKAISLGSKEKLYLGNLDVHRDWGWAPEYVEAMWLMLQQDKADDYIIATGQTNSLKNFVKEVFLAIGLNWKDYVELDLKLQRPSDIKKSWGDPSKAKRVLGWKSRIGMKDIAIRMLNNELF